MFPLPGIELLPRKLQKKFDKSGLELEQNESRLELEVEQDKPKLKGGRNGSSGRYRAEWGHNSTFKVTIIVCIISFMFC